MMILIFRIGTTIPVPGVDTSIISKLVSGNSLLALYNMFTGGAFSNFTLFALGIGPYITASIIIQLLTVGFESLKELQKSGEEGRKKMNMYTRYTALVLAIIQAVGITLGVIKSALTSDSIFSIAAVIMTLVSASMILMWMGDRITEKGLGNGSSIIIFVGIISRIPTDIISVVNSVQSGTIKLWLAIILAIIMLITITLFMGENAQNFVSTYLSTSGDIGFWIYRSLEVLLIVFFSYFYTTISFNVDDIAENMKNNGGFIPGIRPGRPTIDYLSRILSRITLAGALFLAVIAMIPAFTVHFMSVNMSLAGTSILIVVGVALELKRQLESHLVMRSYQGFLK